MTDTLVNAAAAKVEFFILTVRVVTTTTGSAVVSTTASSSVEANLFWAARLSKMLSPELDKPEYSLFLLLEPLSILLCL
jgi:hypothetical protein